MLNVKDRDPFENPLKNFLFIDQLKIMGYGESDTSGCWIKFQLTPELLEVIRGRKGEMVEVAARLIDNGGEYVPPEPGPPPSNDVNAKGPYGGFWHQLIRQGVFNAPPVLEAIGSDKVFQEWVRHQRSCVSGDYDYMDVNDNHTRACEFAHVRRIAEGAGEGIKPPYFGVPLTHEEHAITHQSGEAALLVSLGIVDDDDQAADWFEKKARQYRTEWATNELAEKLGAERRSQCPPERVTKWFEAKELTRYLPAKLRE